VDLRRVTPATGEPAVAVVRRRLPHRLSDRRTCWAGCAGHPRCATTPAVTRPVSRGTADAPAAPRRTDAVG